MAAITINTTDAGKATRMLEDVTITNQSAASTTVRKAVKVPGWAKEAVFLLYHTSAGGTSPSLTFAVEVPDFATNAKMVAPDDGNIAALVTSTAITGTGAYLQTFTVAVGAAAGSGAAAADAAQGANHSLPAWLAYSYTTAGGGVSPEDYAFQLVVCFR